MGDYKSMTLWITSGKDQFLNMTRLTNICTHRNYARRLVANTQGRYTTKRRQKVGIMYHLYPGIYLPRLLPGEEKHISLNGVELAIATMGQAHTQIRQIDSFFCSLLCSLLLEKREKKMKLGDRSEL